MENQKFMTCEGECEDQFREDELKKIVDEGKLKLVCKFCYIFIKSEQEEEAESNYVMAGNVLNKRT